MYVLDEQTSKENTGWTTEWKISSRKERPPPKETEEEAKSKRVSKYHEKRLKKIKQQMEKDVVSGKNASILDFFTDLNGKATKNNDKMTKKVLKARKAKEKRYLKKFEPKEKKFPTPKKMQYAPVEDWEVQNILLENFTKNERPITDIQSYYEQHLLETGYNSGYCSSASEN